jgi:hypothetical protein
MSSCSLQPFCAPDFLQKPLVFATLLNGILLLTPTIFCHLMRSLEEGGYLPSPVYAPCLKNNFPLMSADPPATAPVFYTSNPLAEGLKSLFQKLEDRLELSIPVNVYLAGGMAVYLYCVSRVSTDVDAEFGRRVAIPADLSVDIEMDDGSTVPMYFDTNFNSSFALLHEDYLDDAIPLDMGLKHIRLHVLSPLDLAVSKVARLQDQDKEDIAALVRLGLVTAYGIERRATQAMGGFIGGLAMLKLNIRDAVSLALQVEAEMHPARTDLNGTPMEG